MVVRKPSTDVVVNGAEHSSTHTTVYEQSAWALENETSNHLTALLIYMPQCKYVCIFRWVMVKVLCINNTILMLYSGSDVPLNRFGSKYNWTFVLLLFYSVFISLSYVLINLWWNLLEFFSFDNLQNDTRYDAVFSQGQTIQFYSFMYLSNVQT